MTSAPNVTIRAATKVPRWLEVPVSGNVRATVVGEVLLEDGLVVVEGAADVEGAAVVVVGSAGPDS